MRKLLPVLLAAVLILSGCIHPEHTPPSTETAHTNPATEPAQALTVHYIDVGQADCALVECGGEYMLIDSGNIADSSLVVSYLKRQGVERLAALVGSHPHEDHIGGLPGVLAVFPVEEIYSPTDSFDSECFDDFVRYARKQNLSITIPEPGDSFPLGDAQVTVLGPTGTCSEVNDTSLVLDIAFGDTRFLFTGDMELAAETDMLDYWGEAIPDADVLKVAHHGSDTSTGYRFLRQTAPEYAILSVGSGNPYGHPHESVLSRLQDADCTILSTDTLGTILAVSDGSAVTFSWENIRVNPDADPQVSAVYIGNKKSGKFHSEDCSSLPAGKNRVLFPSLDSALEAGYTPCGNCLGDSRPSP